MFMGIKIILTESQVRRVHEQVSQEIEEMGKANLSCTDTDFSDLMDFLDGKDSKKIGFETYVVKVDDNTVAIKHYRTNIITIDATNIMTLDTNGWRSTTSKDRLNQFINCNRASINQKKGVWYIHGSNGSFEYEDGVEVHNNGYIITPSEKKAEQTNFKEKPHIYGDDSKIDPELRDLYGL